MTSVTSKFVVFSPTIVFLFFYVAFNTFANATPFDPQMGDEMTSNRNKRFYSWEGKRYSNRDKGVDKRKFYPWAGKRSLYGDNAFDEAWPGKRAVFEGVGNVPFNRIGGEKRKFYQWAG